MKNTLKNRPDITFETPQVRNIVVEATKEELVIKASSKNATSPWVFVLLTLLILWAVMSVFVLSNPPPDAILATLLGGFTWILGALSYLLIATSLNQTILTVNDEVMTVEQKPWPVGVKTQQYLVRDIKSIRVGTRTYIFAHSTHRFYGVQLVFRTGRKRRKNILGGFKQTTEPTYIVEMLEEFLA